LHPAQSNPSYWIFIFTSLLWCNKSILSLPWPLVE